MAKPVQPKSLKPKADNAPEASGGGGAPAPKASGGGGGLDLKFIISLVAGLVFSIAGSALTLFLLGPMVLVPAITAQLPKPEAAAEGHGKEGGAHGEHGEAGKEGKGEHEKKIPVLGLNLPMEEFTVNLKKEATVKGNQFLRTKLSLSVQVPEEQNCIVQAMEAAAHHGEAAAAAPAEGGHGGGAPAANPAEACNKAFSENMTPFIPTFRDIINTSLMNRSSSQIASLEGQEALKESVIQELNLVLGGTPYKVDRVNLEDFIIQR
jgi:flagellar basal body-associated protein FliL